MGFGARCRLHAYRGAPWAARARRPDRSCLAFRFRLKACTCVTSTLEPFFLLASYVVFTLGDYVEREHEEAFRLGSLGGLAKREGALKGAVMGRLQMHFAWYMASYTVLMLVSYALWIAAGSPAGPLGVGTVAGALQAVSDFLVNFAVVAYPLYAAIRFIIKRLSRPMGTRLRPVKGETKREVAVKAASSLSL